MENDNGDATFLTTFYPEDYRNPVDAITGLPITAEQIGDLYRRTQFEDRLLLPDRVLAMCTDLFKYLLDTGGPEQKTIIFCARDRHADDVAVCLNNLYATRCAAQGKLRLEYYAFKCTAASNGNDQLPDLRASSRSHFIAATVDLLTTGVDVPCVRNIVLFKYLKSPISFYQMVGRGTRIDAPTGKLMFRVYDYTDAGRFIIADVDGKATPVPVEEYKARLAARLVQEVHTLDDFRSRWIDPPARQELVDALVTSGYSPTVVRMVDEKEDYDLYDVLAELGWGMSPRTRSDRKLAFTHRHEDWLNALPTPAATAIRAIASQFERCGTPGLENSQLFQTPAVRAAGGLAALRLAGGPRALLTETKTRMFAA